MPTETQWSPPEIGGSGLEKRAPIAPDTGWRPPETLGSSAEAATKNADEETARWRNLYAGLDTIDQRASETDKAAFAAMDKVMKNPRDARAVSVNQAFVGSAYGLYGPWISQNWDSVKIAVAEKEFGEKLEKVDDHWLYGKIAARIGAVSQDAAKPWDYQETWQAAVRELRAPEADPSRPDVTDANAIPRVGFTTNAQQFWDSTWKPFTELPDPPADLPDKWMMAGNVPVNPAIMGGLYKGMFKPLIEGLESPGGVATLGAGSALKSVSSMALSPGARTSAKVALSGMNGFFAALMGYSTVKAAPDAIKIAMSPEASTQQKVEAVSGVAGTAALTVLTGLGAVFELLPDKGAKLAKDMEGRTPAQSAERLRQEAVETTNPAIADALNQAAARLDEFNFVAGPDEIAEMRNAGPEKIANAAIKLPDGEVVEGPNHAAIRSELTAPAEPILQAAERVGLQATVDTGGQEGFVTTSGRFVDRAEALGIAEGQGQLKTPVVFHGTKIGKIKPSELKPTKFPEDVIFFTDSTADARQFAGLSGGSERPRVLRATLSINDPLVVDVGGEIYTPEKFSSLIKQAKDNGNDGLVIKNVQNFEGSEPTTTYAVFSKDQISDYPPKIEKPTELHSHQVEMANSPNFEGSAFGRTALKNAYGELERAAYGFADAAPSEKRNMSEAWARAQQVVERNPKAGEQLVERLKNDPNTSLTDDQSAVILRHKVDLQKALNEAADVAADQNQTPELRAEAQRQVAELSDQLFNLLEAVNQRGSEWGREGRWRQALAAEDYSFAAQETLWRAAKGGAELTPAERETLLERVKTLEEAQAKYRAKIAELEAMPRNEAVERSIQRLARAPATARRFQGAEKVRARLNAAAEEATKRFTERRREGRVMSGIDPADLRDSAIVGAAKIYSVGLDFAEWSTAMVTELGPAIKPALAEIWTEAKKLFHTEQRQGVVEALKELSPEERSKDLPKYANELARAKVEQGITTRDALVDAVWDDLKAGMPDVTRRETMDAISGYGKYKELKHDEVMDQLRDLKGQLQQVAKLEDMAAGEAPKKTGVERRTPSDEERRLQKQVEAKKKEGGYAVTDPERQLRTAMQAVRRSLENRIKDLARELETGEKPPRPEKAPPTDPKIEALRAVADRIRETLEDVEGKPELTPEERIERAVESTSKAIERLENQLNEGQVFPDPTKTDEPWSPALSKLKKELEDLRGFRKEMQRLARPPKTPEQRALDAAKSATKRQIESLEKQIAKGEKLEKPKRTAATDAELEALRARRDELREEFDELFKPGPTDEQRLNLWKANARRRIATLEERLANNELYPEPRKPVPMDQEAYKLKAEVERVKQDIMAARARAEEAQQPTWYRGLKRTQELARAGALTGYHTIGKLLLYGVAKFAEKPFVQAVDSAIRRVPGFREIAKRGQFESGPFLDNLAKFYTNAATKGLRDAVETMTPANKGKSALKAELGEREFTTQAIHWYDYIGGILHMAEKSPLLRAEFERALSNGYRWALKEGMDVTNEFVQGAIRKGAFDYAHREILMENNWLAEAIRAFEAKLEKIDPGTKEYSAPKMVLATVAKVFLTKDIVRVPSNYLFQTVERTPVAFAINTLRAASKIRGVDKLTPAEADAITRLLKVGAVGSAMFVWGMIDASKDPKDRMFGGYYQPGEKRGENDVGVGKIRVGNVELPHLATHNPLTEVAQMGSTMYRVMKTKFRGGARKGEEKGVMNASMAVLFALGSQAPIASPTARLAQDAARGEADKFYWDAVAGLIPAFVQNLASDLDQGKARKADSLKQSIEKNLPVLRENVPETKAQKEKNLRDRLNQQKKVSVNLRSPKGNPISVEMPAGEAVEMLSARLNSLRELKEALPA